MPAGNLALTPIAARYRHSPDYRQPLPVSSLPWIEEQIWERQRAGQIPEITKWESCLALPLADDQQFNWNTETVELEINSEHRDYPRHQLQGALRQTLDYGTLVGEISWELINSAEVGITESTESRLSAPGFAVLSPEISSTGR